MSLRESAAPPGPRADALSELTEPALEQWGRRLGRTAMQERLFVALFGPLGAGKTTLVRAACRGAGVAEPVLSPTFTLVRRYSAPSGPVYHADLYRVSGPEDLPDLGWEDLLAADGPVFVEWADRARGWLPEDRWEVHLEMGGRPDTRRVDCRSWGEACPPCPPTPGHPVEEPVDGDSPAGQSAEDD